eukprot:CAMPEP_0198644546 /NCGR_PEP_ID=MMETSP1467-20131203/695_1 /TAXON_ID=1462469 /ORGANISM="unid. sp., Strain CCMP2135" /LENGTH=128 /DNA_ID=CAMNT_0044380003 /DNA_START=145 /DNA_END=531 /DNA_ORIENTATION=-
MTCDNPESTLGWAAEGQPSNCNSEKGSLSARYEDDVRLMIVSPEEVKKRHEEAAGTSTPLTSRIEGDSRLIVEEHHGDDGGVSIALARAASWATQRCENGKELPVTSATWSSSSEASSQSLGTRSAQR